VRIGLLVLVCTQALNVVLVPWLGHAGLTLSISLAALLNAGLLLAGLMRRGIYKPSAGWGRFGLQLALALSALAALLSATHRILDWQSLADSPWLRIGATLGTVAIAAVVYLSVLVLAGLRPRGFLRPPQ